MATLRNKRNLAATAGETQEEHPENGQLRNTYVPRINEEYITQVSKEIEGRVTKKLSQEFSGTDSSILGALSKLDEFLLNPQVRIHSGTVSGISQNDRHPEVGSSVYQSHHSVDSNPDEAPHSHFTQKAVQIITDEFGSFLFFR